MVSNSYSGNKEQKLTSFQIQDFPEKTSEYIKKKEDLKIHKGNSLNFK